MRVSELIEMLKDQPPDAEVELAVVAPVDADSDDDITVDRYSVEGMLPWNDEADDGSEELVIWLVGGEDGDVEAFLDAIENDEHEHDHDGHDHAGHDHQH